MSVLIKTALYGNDEDIEIPKKKKRKCQLVNG